MNNKVFSNWLTKNNIKFEVVKMGDDFFYNAPSVKYEAITINLECEQLQDLINLDKKIQKYIKKYNLDVFLSGRYWFSNYYNVYTYSFTVRTAENKAISDNYYFYRDQAREEIEILFHEYHTAGLYKTMHKQANKQAREIMNHYGELYAKSLEAGENAA